jgi:hypothetical protein
VHKFRYYSCTKLRKSQKKESSLEYPSTNSSVASQESIDLDDFSDGAPMNVEQESLGYAGKSVQRRSKQDDAERTPPSASGLPPTADRHGRCRSL